MKYFTPDSSDALDIMYRDFIEEPEKFNRLSLDIKINEDRFNGSKILKFKNIGWFCSDKIQLSSIRFIDKFNVGFANIKGKDYLTFECLKLVFPLSKNDIVSFCFEEDIIINYTLDSEPLKKEYQKLRLVLENKVQITGSELEIFENKKLVQWKLQSKKGIEVLGDVSYFSKYTKYNQAIFNLAAKSYREAVSNHIDNYYPLNER